MADDFSLQWAQFGAGVAAVGSLGLAAFGVTEALGKALVVSLGARGKYLHYGLPYVGFGAVKSAIRPLRPALEVAYGANSLEILAQQYRAGRSQGKAADTIRQGVRLGLPFMPVADAAKVIGGVWNMGGALSTQLAAALQAPGAGGSPPPTPAGAASGAVDPTQALAGRFATALDARVYAAFALADERYESQAKLLSGLVAVLLALGFNYGLGAGLPGHAKFSWFLAIGIGIVAVPLAPVAKDLSSSLQSALTAFKSIPGGKG
jgi:hypothetical protein